MERTDIDIDIGGPPVDKEGSTEEETVILVGGEDEAPSEEETVIMVGETEVEEEEHAPQSLDLEVQEEPESDDRDMISVGMKKKEKADTAKERPSKKRKKKVEKKEEPVEEKEPEEIPEKDTDIPPPRKKRKAAGIAILAVIAAALLVLAGVYLVYQAPLVPTITAPENAIAGGLVEVSAEGSIGDITNYSWDFGDGVNALGKEATHIYSDDGPRTITLTITDGNGRSVKETSSITVHPIVIVLPPERYGESVDYDTSISMSVTHPVAITTKEVDSNGINEEVSLREVYLWMNGTSTSHLENGGVKEDGFMEDWSTANVSSYQDLNVEGTILSSSGTGHISGPLQVWESTFSELRENKSVQSKLSSYGDFHISVGSIDEDFETKDVLYSYPDPTSDSERFSVERLRTNRTFTHGDTDVKNLGAAAYSWNIVGADRILDRPCLVLDIQIDQDTMNDNGITDFSMRIWICNDTFFPAKSVVYTVQQKNGNTTIMRTESTMTDITQGSQNVNYQSGSASFYTSWAQKETTLAPDFTTTWGRLPAHTVSVNLQNQDAIADDFTADDALSLATINNAGFSNYLSSHPNAYCTNSRYGKDNILLGTNQKEWWNLTFMDSTSAMGVNVTLQRVPATGYSYDIWTPELENIAEKANITPVLSYEGAQWIMNQNDHLDPVFSGGRMDLDNGQFGTEENITLPLVSPTAMMISPSVDYGYIVEHSEDGIGGFTLSTRGAIDAETGRSIYVWLHRDNMPALNT